MEVTEIETLMARMRATGMGELQWRHADSLLRLVRSGGGQVERDDAAAQAPMATPRHIVRAAAVGTLVAHHPVTREPFTARGARVKHGDVIALIEYAGFLREVIAHADGIVRDVLANDASLIEFGQPLVAIDIEVQE